MQLDAAEVYDPSKTGSVVDYDFFGRAPRWKGKCDGPKPLRSILRRALLIERLLLGAVNESLEHVRPISYAGDGPARDGQVILDDVELRKLDVAREVRLGRIRYPDFVS